MTSKPKLEKWQRVDKAFPTEPGIDWSKVKLTVNLQKTCRKKISGRINYEKRLCS